MNDHSETELNSKQEDVSITKSTSSSDELSSSRNSETSEPSTVARKNPTISAPQDPAPPSSHIDLQQSRVIINGYPVISETKETTRQQTFKIPANLEGGVPCSKQEIVGDDFSKKSEVHIACECEPTVAGAAVPTVQSFIPIEHQASSSGCRKSNSLLLQTSPKGNENVNPQSESETTPLKYKAKQVSKIAQLIKDGKASKIKPNRQEESPCSKTVLRKPSLIPKLARPNSNSEKLDKNEKRDFVQSRSNSDHQRSLLTSSALSKDLQTNSTSNCEASSYVNTISSRMLGLQERLKATTSMLRQKMEADKSKEVVFSDEHSLELAIEEEEIIKELPLSATTSKTVDDLYNSIFRLKEVASSLLENNSLKGQSKYIEKLFLNISEIKLIADKLRMPESESKLDTEIIVADKVEPPKSPSSTNTQVTKDNKIYIKFMHARDKKLEGKKKTKDFSSDGGDDPQNNVVIDSKVTSDSETCLEKNQDSKVKEADSMDGVFIPSCEPPKNMEDDEETNGLDITITFPEFSHLYSNCSESHLSVCLSDISAEALKKLKRCPKDFTLRMDFVEGKVHFQSGKGPANNFQIGPDLKFCENIIDTKKSDVISIKPSTECSFGSQLIPVDSPKQIKSFKSLKSTDSELFNVVSLPFLYTNPYLATSHKSCITFRNDRIMSMAILATHIFKSMPQIPSLTNIFENKVMESPSKAGSREKTKKSIESEKMDQC